MITLSGSRAGSIIQQSVHVTESRAIASRCPKLRTSKGHLVYKRPPATSQLRSRKPILSHACYNHTHNTYVLYEQQVSSHNSTKYFFTDLHIDHTKINWLRSTIHHTTEEN